MKRYIHTIAIICFFALGLTTVSCEDYLDKAPDAGVSESDAFGNFISFQGFTEELYYCLPDYTKATWVADWNIADEVLATTGANWRLTVAFDNGNYWDWMNSGWGQSYIGNFSNDVNTNDDAFSKNYYSLCWYGIRKANVGLLNIENLVEATQEEKDIIQGQLLFFRGFFHFQLMSFWGGLPYIDKVLASEKMDFPRLKYQEMAELAAADLAAAAELLPANWDNTAAGQRTLGNNNQRITKSVAYAYLGKNLLYAASPLMNLESKGVKEYDTELCKRAAEAFTQCLKLSDSGAAHYQLMDWENYEYNFYSLDGSVPGYPETMMASPAYGGGGGYWPNFSLNFPPGLGGDGNMISPAHSYVKNFGMASGLPIDDPASGYDPSDPWSNRDPRFYKTIVYDGVRVIRGEGNADFRFANLYNDGNYRNDGTGSRSGYMMRKFMNLSNNNTDAEGRNIIILPPYLRLADVYYMYAEAVLHGYGTPTSSHSGYLTAADAVNKVRARAGVPNVAESYLASKDAFMKVLIQERAVELAFEANIRFMDLRRWMLAEQKQYKEKTAIDFDRGTDGKPINMTERVVVTRVFERKHYWLPLPLDQVNLYPELYQNPGW
ncbi:MAG: RagB/SusD family nutrient uptake outer membrane protein [Prolixibacteraceae bacterium]|nr:RagB/SusD family nutrient uptake outer membrane protein [Prolixibacteraceae bacterium]